MQTGKRWNFSGMWKFDPKKSSSSFGGSLVSEEFLAQMGRVIVGWSNVEFQFHWLLLSFVALKGANEASMTDPEIIRVMGLSLDRQVEEFKKRMTAICVPVHMRMEIVNRLGLLKALRKKRDEVAHAQWSPILNIGELIPADKASAQIMSWKNRRGMEVREMTLPELRKAFEAMHRLAWDLHMLSLNHEWQVDRSGQPAQK